MKILLRLFALLLCTLSAKLHAGNLKVDLAPSGAVSAGAQWRVDGGSWRGSGSTASGLSNGNHTVDFKAVSGWITPASTSVAIGSGTTTTTATYLQPSSLKITLSPTTGQWRIDGGTWRASAATVSGLTPGNHTIDYAAVAGWATPATETVALTAGQTTTLTRNYTQLSQLKITLTPSSAQWRVDGGAWQASGATVSNLTPGSHAVSYSAVTGFATPATENVTLTSGQLLNLNRSYTQLSQLKITLAPTSAQWRVDGGTWQASGATVSNLTPGSHAVSYSAVTGFATPASENVTLVSGQLLNLNRSYVQLAQLKITLSPTNAQWNVDGGSWQASGATVSDLSVGSHTVNYAPLAGHTAPASETVSLTAGQLLSLNRSYVPLAQLTVTLSPSTAQWRVDGGAWLASGATAPNLSPGTHAVSYSSLAGWASPNNESVTLTAGQTLALARSYTQLVPVSITLTPATGQWRLNGGAWQASGASLSVLPGTYTADYAALALYDSPASETFTLASGGSLTATRSYVSQKPSLTINLNAGGQWRIDAGAWQNSGARVTALEVGEHNLEYLDVGGILNPPPAETVTLALRENLTLERSYTLKPSSLQVILSAEGAQWRAYQNEYSSGWQQSGATITDLPHSNYNIEYSYVSNHVTPAPENVSVAPGETLSIERTYTELALFSISLTPSSGRWRIDGGQWRNSPYTLSDVSLGNHTIDFSAPLGYVPLPSETVTLVAGSNPTLTRTFQEFASVRITLTPASAQWRIDGGFWEQSSQALGGFTPGNHTLEFSAVPGYITPAPETVTLISGLNPTLTRNYVQNPSLSVVLNPTSAQWRLDGVGPWQNSSTTLIDLAPGTHTLEFSSLSGYSAPPSENVTLAIGSPVTLLRSYTPLAVVAVTLNPSSAQWRIDGGVWRASSSSAFYLSIGAHTLDYSNVTGYVTLPSETVTLVSGVNAPLSRTYTPLATFSITLNPSSAQWRIDGGLWYNSSVSVSNLPLGVHTLEFSSVTGYITPAPETVTLVSGINPPLVRTYTPLAEFGVTLTPDTAQWRIDGGAWHSTYSSERNLSLGTHTVEFSNVAGYVTPAPATVTLVSGMNQPLVRTYTPLAEFGVTLTPNTAQWRIDGGAWHYTYISERNLSLGTHTVEFSDLPGYITPAPESVTLVSGMNQPLVRTYTQLASVTVTLTPSSAQWRIDGGAWQNSASTLADLLPGDHTLSYSNAAGYATPPSETVTLVSGSNPGISRSYTALPYGQLSVTLENGIGQWNVNNGPWQSSGATVANLPTGNNTVRYASVSGYVPPVNEIVNIVSAQTTSLSRSYVRVTKLTITLPPVDGQWRVDTGGWRNSGTTYSNIPVGTHTITYSTVGNYSAPPTETITIAAGDQLAFTRTYIPLTQIVMTLNPSNAQWRLDGGAWQPAGTVLTTAGSHTIDYQPVASYVTPPSETVTVAQGQTVWIYGNYGAPAQLSVLLYPSSAQWRIDGGSWQSNGAYVTGLTPGVPHLVEYSTVFGYATPPSETLTFSSGQSLSLSRYHAMLAQVMVSLYPSAAQWRIDGGAWQASGATVQNLLQGDHVIDYQPLLGYSAPPSETITLSSGQQFTALRYYQTVTQINLTLTPATAQWRIDGGAWQNSGASVYNLTPGSHTVDFSEVDGYAKPAPMNPFLTNGQVLSLTQNYTPAARLTLTLTPAQAEWKIDGGAWQPSGATVSGLYPGYHRIDYKDVIAFTAPSFEMVNLPGGQLTSLSRNYTALALLTIKTLPSNTRWRVNGSSWWLNDMTFTASASGNYTVEYETPASYQPIPTETVTLTAGTVVSLTRSSPTVTSPAAGRLIVHANPGAALTNGFPQFGVNLMSAYYAGWYFCETSVPLPAGTHYLNFAQGVVGWEEPAPIAVTITPGATTEITVNFRYVHHLKFYLNASLTAGLTSAEIDRRLTQYVAHINTIFRRESLRTFVFQSYYDLTVGASDPFIGTPPAALPVFNFPLSIYATLTDNAAVGTYGGRPAIDASGGGGGTDFKWDQIYDPAVLVDGSPQLEQYWRQIHHLVRVLELSFGAGAGEYASLAGMKDASSVAPVLADTAAVDSATPDSFWSGRTEYWGDPLTANAWANPRIGAPTSLTTLLNVVSFASVTEGLVNGVYRGAPAQSTSLPNLASVVVKAVDSVTGQPVITSTVRVWNRSSPTAPFDGYEETVTTGGSAGTFTFAWTGSPLTNVANAKLIKVSAPGYTPTATWITSYDAQKAKVVEGKSVFEISVSLTPQ